MSDSKRWADMEARIVAEAKKAAAEILGEHPVMRHELDVDDLAAVLDIACLGMAISGIIVARRHKLIDRLKFQGEINAYVDKLCDRVADANEATPRAVTAIKETSKAWNWRYEDDGQ